MVLFDVCLVTRILSDMVLVRRMVGDVLNQTIIMGSVVHDMTHGVRSNHILVDMRQDGGIRYPCRRLKHRGHKKRGPPRAGSISRPFNKLYIKNTYKKEVLYIFLICIIFYYFRHSDSGRPTRIDTAIQVGRRESTQRFKSADVNRRSDSSRAARTEKQFE